MTPISSWAANARIELKNLSPILQLSPEINLALYLTHDSLWLVKTWDDHCRTAFRTAFSPSGALVLKNIRKYKGNYLVKLSTASLDFQVRITTVSGENYFRYTFSAKAKNSLLIPYWPKDILSFDDKGNIKKQGKIHTFQRGTRSGVIYFNDGQSGSVFYLQNLGALNRYFETTQSSAAATVGGQWPEVGFALPPSKKPLKINQNYILSDALVSFSRELPDNPVGVAAGYLDHLALLYPLLSKPELIYHNWLETVNKGLNDLIYHKGCWSFGGGHSYLNAYVADYKNPPEVMVQLAVLLPMLDFLDWKGETSHPLVDELRAGLPGFYEPDMGTIVRWLPALEQNLDSTEEQKKQRVMDSWYLHHPLMNLARLTERGDKMAESLLMDSIDYAIKVAHRFKYQWPVFYQMDTLNVIKAETAEGAGGEKDVPGTYADLMLRLWKITGECRYLTEAKRAAKKLEGLGFDIFYQANNTAYTAGAMIRMFRETGDKIYLDLSYVCLAALFDNMQLWECDYGHAKNFPTFFAVFPLKDAPYTAAYEEQEVYSALHDYLIQAQGIEIKSSVKLLIAEFIKHIACRVAYYYPPMLKKEMIATSAKTGEVDGKLWIALEDLHDGWEASGEVGQEVYGAGIAFGIIPRQYHKVKNERFLVFCDYPIFNFIQRGKALSFSIGGDQRLNCKVILLPQDILNGYHFTLSINGQQVKADSEETNDGRMAFTVCGNQKISINWSKRKSG